MFALCSPDNKSILSLLTIVAMAIISLTVWSQTRDRLRTGVFLLSAIFVYCHQAARTSVYLPIIYSTEKASQLVELSLKIFLCLNYKFGQMWVADEIFK